MSERIVTIHDAPYPDGELESCYALVTGEDISVAIAITIKRAIELQRDGSIYYDATAGLTPESFDRFFAPDFPPIREWSP